MRFKRISLIVVSLLLVSGCTASRRAQRADIDDEGASRIRLPIRHADEYDSGDDGFMPDESSGRPTPPPVPPREPLPAPPAIGVSRVKSVSWLRTILNKSNHPDCGTEQCSDECRIGEQTQLPPEYFTKGCTGQLQCAAEPSLALREKPSALQTMRSWGHGLKKRFNNSASPRQPGERVVADSPCASEGACATATGCTSGEGCTSSGLRAVPQRHNPIGAPVPRKSNHSSRSNSLAAPIDEFGWENPSATGDDAATPEKATEVPSKPTTAPPEPSPSTTVPGIPALDAAPLIPAEQPQVKMPYNNFPRQPLANPAEPQPGASGNTTQPPVWPRLTGPTAKSIAHPQITPTVDEDFPLPLIMPGRGI